MTMTRTPGTAPAGQSTDPGRRRGGVRIAGFSIRLTRGAYLLAMLAVVLSALSLGAAAPGRPASAYAAATAGVVVLLLASMIGHELAHAVAARRHGAGSGEISVGFFGDTVHSRYQLPTRAQCRAAAAGPAVSLAAAGLSVAAAAGQVTAAALAAAGLVALALGYIGGLGLGLIGFLMFAASRAEARQVLLTAALAGLRVRDVLPPSPVAAVHSWQTVRAFLDGEGPGAVRAGPAGSAATAFPLRDFDGGLAGLLTLSQLAAVPAGRRERRACPRLPPRSRTS